MNRRESLKAIGLTAVSTGVLLEACKTDNKKATTTVTADENNAGREAFEIERNKKLNEERFFTDHEMLTITVLADIIIPKDEKSGSASDAKVPEFIEFIVKDIPSHQVPVRGGLRWLDTQCLNRYNNAFKDATPAQQLEMVNDIAWPEKVKPGMEQGVAFFNRMRDLTASGFFTSEMGVKDLGYAGNMPNKWEGVPEDVLKQYGLENV
ncbi:gluconate 2-dehydrogenase subunit 3 family protein [Agriterribacter sp.]|uniref:gluconate 2-dehydrogenase subunit 3 family protein n=1 Tax=Agriterribacter sp. TaxID=2821509 RepID=UPI002C3212CE|nr:gluconate 2-dehydrogenase subunit 3 family protein [Agriterribacter sp.]HRP58276.1 gluconate 2-dehydrogenase subunit 3 family protein [Agriterribacter sp.]